VEVTKMRIKPNYKVPLFFALVLISTFTLNNLHTEQPIFVAGDDLPIYIGTSIPIGLKIL
jgi:hypothetical protein